MAFAELPPPIRPDRLPRDPAGAAAWLRLARSRNVGSGSFRRLMARFPSAAAAVAALPDLAAEGGVRDYVPAAPEAVAAELDAARAIGARMLCLGAPDYPARLARIGAPPPVLWALGDPRLAARPAVAIVGARNASSLGLRMARLLAGDLGTRGFAVVSGLARGIDTAAHRAALRTGTIAVLAGGLDRIYPEENAGLAAEIASAGLLLSETAMGVEPTARHFPRRNRLVSGLSDGVVLIEAADRSGSLVTARCALEQGREVMAVPGSPLDPRAAGCNRLIRDGATLIRAAEDVVAALGLPEARPSRSIDLPAIPPDGPPPAGDLTQRLAGLLAAAPVSEDDLVRAAGAPAGEVLQALVELDLAGRLDRRPGGLVALLA